MTHFTRRTLSTFAAALLLAAAGSAARAGTAAEQLAETAAGVDADLAKTAIHDLREMGPAGLAAMVNAHKATLGAHRADPAKDARDPAWLRLKAAMDQVAAQKDAHASRLYWYTDLAAAQKAAEATHKPILSLRMLGKLTDDLSCANSRFFRTTLYANAEVGDYLREHFILHWESVRPVPKITIDMGDGRKVERTITGNSIHYVLDSKGRVVDGLPGLYGPKAFAARLGEAEVVAGKVATLDDAGFAAAVKAFHTTAAEAARKQWAADLTVLNVPLSFAVTGQPVALAAVSPAPEVVTDVVRGQIEAPAAADPRVLQIATAKALPERPLVRAVAPVAKAPPTAVEAARVTDSKTKAELPAVREIVTGAPSGGTPVAANPPALAAAPIAIGKGAVEVPVLKAITPDAASLAKATDDQTWARIASLHAADAAVDRGTLTLITDKSPSLAAANATTISKRFVETPLARMARNLQGSIAIDTVKNEYTLHVSIHEWLAAAATPVSLKDFNERVYADLFLTPSSDPWLGLVPPDTFCALDDEGLLAETAKR